MGNILFFDIETVSCVSTYEQLSPALQLLRDKKCSYMKESIELTPSELFSLKAGIYSEFGKVVCIVCGYQSSGDDSLTTKAFFGHNEQQMLSDFIDMLSTLSTYVLCGHNIKEFDVPYICRRATLYGLSLPSILDVRGKKPREVSLVDTMELRSFGDRKNYTSLTLLCEIFAIESPKDDIDGSEVSAIYRNDNDLDRIVQYCTKDVIATAKVYNKLKIN